MSSEIITNRFELVREIGRGGYGSVWLARDRETGRQVAIKRLDVLPRSGDSGGMRQRIEREAAATARVDHPNVVSIYDIVRAPDGSEISLVMEHLAGVTLDQLLEHGPLEETRARRLVAQALRGLHAAHEAGVVHKDLKPSNLFVVSSNVGPEILKVIDFGIARMDSLPSLTATGRVMGSARYLAPEYITGEDVTRCVDIYQMGLILAEIVTGTPAVSHVAFAEACRRHVKGELEFDDSLKMTTLWPIVRKATAPNPEDRYATAAEFAAAVESLGEANPLEASRKLPAPAPALRAASPDDAEGPRLAFEAAAEESANTGSVFRAIPLGVMLVIAAAIGVGAALIVHDATSDSDEVAISPAEPPEPTPSPTALPSPEQLVEVASYDVSTALLTAELEARIGASDLIESDKVDVVSIEDEMLSNTVTVPENWLEYQDVLESAGKNGLSDAMRDPRRAGVVNLPNALSPETQAEVQKAMRNPRNLSNVPQAPKYQR